MWRGGCIIRSVFLKDITKAFRSNPDLENLLFDDFFNKAVHAAQAGWRNVVASAVKWGVPTPAFSTALAFFDGYRTEDLPANLLQAQRDYFGGKNGFESSLVLFDETDLLQHTPSASSPSSPARNTPRAR